MNWFWLDYKAELELVTRLQTKLFVSTIAINCLIRTYIQVDSLLSKTTTNTHHKTIKDHRIVDDISTSHIYAAFVLLHEKHFLLQEQIYFVY